VHFRAFKFQEVERNQGGGDMRSLLSFFLSQADNIIIVLLCIALVSMNITQERLKKEVKELKNQIAQYDQHIQNTM
jgi:hypothetical protein